MEDAAVRAQVEADYAAALLISDEDMLASVGAALGAVLCLVEDLREGYRFLELEPSEQETLACAGQTFRTYVDRVLARSRLARGEDEDEPVA